MPTNGFSIKPLKVVLDFNYHKVLAKPVPKKLPRNQPVVLAGNARASGSGSHSEFDHSTTRDPWLDSDPWQTFRPSSATSARHTGAQGSVPAEKRTVIGPVAELFEKQGSRIAHLEATICEIQKDQRGLLDLQQKQYTEHSQVVQNVRTEFSNTLHQVKTELHQAVQTSITAAGQQQEARMNEQFSELKALLLEERSTRRRTADMQS